MTAIKLARRLFANTPVQKLPFTTYVKRKVFRYGYSDDVLTTSFRGVRLTFPSTDTTIVPGLVGGFYEKIELDLFEMLARTSRVILDVGGCIGDYTCVGAANLPAGGRIITFEPVSENVDYIHKNLAQNALQSMATVEAVAVGEVDGAIKIYLAKDDVGTHSAAPICDDAEEILVPMIALDSYMKQHNLTQVDIVKIDVEGYDGYVLRGAKRLLEELKPTIFIEFVSDHLRRCGFSPEEFVELLTSNYRNIYGINEARGILIRVTDADLEYLASHSMNANLVLTDNPEHRELIEGWMSIRPAGRMRSRRGIGG